MQTDADFAMALTDTFGWLATALMLATFHCDSQRRMRGFALAANLCFIVYGSIHGLLPVVILHTLLFPINLHKLLALRGGAALRAEN